MNNTLQDATAICREWHDLPEEVIPPVIDALLDETVSTDIKAEFLRALTDKHESAREVTAFARHLLPHAVDPGFSHEWNGKLLLDCCGTGGGGLSIFNVSTGIVFILAAVGVPVVKHGNRGVSKKSGSADVLEALGIKTRLNPQEARQCLEKVGATFFFAPDYHPAFARVADARQLLAKEGRRTIFNLLGPVLNPARPGSQITGVFHREQLSLYDASLRALGRKQHLVVWGNDKESNRAIGEVSVTGHNEFFGTPDPGNWRIPVLAEDVRELEVDSARQSAERIVAILEKRDRSLGRMLLLINAAVALCVNDPAVIWSEAIDRCEEALNSGAAAHKIQQWREAV